MFEYIYFSRPDSLIGGKTAYEHRKNIGRELAKENNTDADIVVPVPDSGNAAAMGCLLYTSPSPRDATLSRMPSSA